MNVIYISLAYSQMQSVTALASAGTDFPFRCGWEAELSGFQISSFYTVSHKTSMHLWLAITLTHMNGFWHFLPEMLGPIKYFHSRFDEEQLPPFTQRLTAWQTWGDLANTEHVGNTQQDAMLPS